MDQVLQLYEDEIESRLMIELPGMGKKNSFRIMAFQLFVHHYFFHMLMNYFGCDRPCHADDCVH